MKKYFAAFFLTMMFLLFPISAQAAMPIVTGDFIQGWQFAPYSRAQISAHFTELKEAGIQYVIINDSARIENDYVRESYFPTNPALDAFNNNRPWGNNLIEYILSAAQDTGIKVFVGLAYDRAWWDNCLPINTTWYQSRAELGNVLAQDIYDMFKHRFPDAFYGWYFPHEFFNNKQGQEIHFANFVNINRDFLWDLDDTMPMLISPFFAREHRNPTQTRAELINFFNNTNFRRGDIYAPQDCVGVGRATIAESVEYFRAIQEARDATLPWLKLWANNENFTPAFGTAPLSRLIEQIHATAPFVEKHITFSYSHYYASLITQTRTHHLAYVAYYQEISAQFKDLGDINGDGVVNAADITLLRRYLASSDKIAFRQNNVFNADNADMDLNGVIDHRDLMLLRRLIAS
jgi:hypothetical protein